MARRGCHSAPHIRICRTAPVMDERSLATLRMTRASGALLPQLQTHPLVLPLVGQPLEGLDRLAQLAGRVHQTLVQPRVVDELAGGPLALVDLGGDALELTQDVADLVDPLP